MDLKEHKIPGYTLKSAHIQSILIYLESYSVKLSDTQNGDSKNMSFK